jgi:hypothetical protein
MKKYFARQMVHSRRRGGILWAQYSVIRHELWNTNSSAHREPAVIRTMVHPDVRIAVHCQHPELELLRAALDREHRQQ